MIMLLENISENKTLLTDYRVKVSKFSEGIMLYLKLTLCYVFISLAVITYPEQTQLRGGKVYLSTQV